MAAKPDTAYLYVMGTSDGPMKVGHSLKPERRLKDIQRTTKGTIILTGTWPIGIAIALSAERYVHWKLRERHIRGEWFNAPKEEILAAIQQALNREGEFERWASPPPLDAPGKALRYGEHIATKYAQGTKDRISSALEDGEGMAAFIREAVERELKRREKKAVNSTGT